jgi:Flp pilus assembly pilin Flp
MKNQKGQALVEYILIVALMSILIISLVKFFGGYVKDSLTKTSCNIAGLEYIKGKKPGDGTCSEEKTDKIEDEDYNEEETEEDE